MTVDGIPVTHWGVKIGTARINEDGRIDMILDGSHEFGKKLEDAIRVGMVDGLSLSPMMSPASPARADSPRLRIQGNVGNYGF